jgi:methylamine--corrinoid protein Co-methyltransferase
MLQFWEIADRAINTGRLMKVKDFDLKVFKVATRLAKEYGIQYDPKVPIPSSDSIADRVFEAGLKLYAETGTYCLDTERVIQFTQEEIRESLVDLSRMENGVHIGTGLEKRYLFKRNLGDTRKPLVIGGVVESNPREGRDFVQLYKSIAQERIIDGMYYGPPPHSIEGKKWLLGSPLECHAAKSSIAWVREAIRSVGRPGLHLVDASPSAIGTVSSCDPENGLRRTDAFALPTISELKVNFEVLNKVAYSLHYGCLRNPYWTSIIGGFAGGPEGCAVTSVAAALNALLVYYVGGSGFVCNATLLQNPALNSARQTLWVRNISTQAIVRNMNLICGGGALTAAGPGTEQQLWEIAAVGIAISSGGGHIIDGCRKSVLVKVNQATGMEPRWFGEVARAAASLRREEANELVDFLLQKYEDKMTPEKAPAGYSFADLYDYENVTVKPEYFDLYSRVKKTLEERGLNFS